MTKRPECACVNPDARECLRLRHHLTLRQMDDLGEQECECACHRTDLAGDEGWDDDDPRTKVLMRTG